MHLLWACPVRVGELPGKLLVGSALFITRLLPLQSTEQESAVCAHAHAVHLHRKAEQLFLIRPLVSA